MGILWRSYSLSEAVLGKPRLRGCGDFILLRDALVKFFRDAEVMGERLLLKLAGVILKSWLVSVSYKTEESPLSSKALRPGEPARKICCVVIFSELKHSFLEGGGSKILRLRNQQNSQVPESWNSQDWQSPYPRLYKKKELLGSRDSPAWGGSWLLAVQRAPGRQPAPPSPARHARSSY